MFVQQREILLAFTALLACLLIGGHAIATKLALANDNVIDTFESYHLDGITLIKMLAFFACVQFVGMITIDYFLAGPVQVPCMALILVVLVVLAISYLPFLGRTMLLWAGDEDDEEGGKEEVGEEDEDDDGESAD
jgi:hypothetical protein